MICLYLTLGDGCLLLACIVEVISFRAVHVEC